MALSRSFSDSENSASGSSYGSDLEDLYASDSVDNSADDTDVISASEGPQPYRFEPPVRRLADEDPPPPRPQPQLAGSENAPNRLETTDWCQCGTCMAMPTLDESVCCSELPQVWQKVLDEKPAQEFRCITEHPGFYTGCLDRWSLEIAYLHYRQDYGHYQGNPCRRMRYTAYRQLVRWCWGCLGKNIRVPLPACCVRKIRDTWPSDQDYTGFKFLQ